MESVNVNVNDVEANIYGTTKAAVLNKYEQSHISAERTQDADIKTQINGVIDELKRSSSPKSPPPPPPCKASEIKNQSHYSEMEPHIEAKCSLKVQQTGNKF